MILRIEEPRACLALDRSEFFPSSSSAASSMRPSPFRKCGSGSLLLKAGTFCILQTL